MPVSDHQLIGLVHQLTSPDARTRSGACDTVTDWISAFDRFQARMPAMALATSAAVETEYVDALLELDPLTTLPAVRPGNAKAAGGLVDCRRPRCTPARVVSRAD